MKSKTHSRPLPVTNFGYFADLTWPGRLGRRDRDAHRPQRPGNGAAT